MPHAGQQGCRARRISTAGATGSAPESNRRVGQPAGRPACVRGAGRIPRACATKPLACGVPRSFPGWMSRPRREALCGRFAATLQSADVPPAPGSAMQARRSLIHLYGFPAHAGESITTSICPSQTRRFPRPRGRIACQRSCAPTGTKDFPPTLEAASRKQIRVPAPRDVPPVPGTRRLAARRKSIEGGFPSHTGKPRLRIFQYLPAPARD